MAQVCEIRSRDPTHTHWGHTPSVLEYALARAHLDAEPCLYDDPRAPNPGFSLGAVDPLVAALSFAALVLWLSVIRTRPEQEHRGARVLAQELSHLFSLALPLDSTRLRAASPRSGKQPRSEPRQT